MSKKNSSKYRQKLSKDALSLIVRKLQLIRHEQEQLLTVAKQASYTKLHEEVLINIRKKRTGLAFNTVPLEVYSDIVAHATILTKELPQIVWKNIKPILDSFALHQINRSEIKTIVDKFTWSISQKPFTLAFIEPKLFKEYAIREAGRYGGISEKNMASFSQTLDLAAASASTNIINEARNARIKSDITIDEYFITYSQSGEQEQTETQANLSTSTAPSVQNKNSFCCLKTPPSKTDDWFLVINEMAKAFYKDYERCPNVSEAWNRLRTSPPKSYGITYSKHNGENALFMGDQALGKRAFDGRWRRYTKNKSS